MTAWSRHRGYEVNHKCDGRLLREMGIAAIYPKPRHSQLAERHEIHPYRLHGVTIARLNQVYGEYVGESRPARATVQVAKLPRGALVEIEAVALA